MEKDKKSQIVYLCVWPFVCLCAVVVVPQLSSSLSSCFAGEGKTAGDRKEQLWPVRLHSAAIRQHCREATRPEYLTDEVADRPGRHFNGVAHLVKM